MKSSIYTASNNVAQAADIKEWIMRHRLPTSLELTQATFQKVMNAPQKPLVVIAAVDFTDDEHEKTLDHLKDVAKRWKMRTGGTGLASDREVVFTVMDTGRWATWLKSMYGVQGAASGNSLDAAPVVVADHGKLVYYNTDANGKPISFTYGAQLFTAIEDAASGKTAYKNSENFAERLARSLNNYMQSLEGYILEHPIKTIMFALGFVILVIWGLTKLFSGAGGADEWREMKGKNGRLD